MGVKVDSEFNIPADMCRQIAEGIAAAIEADAEKRRPKTIWRKIRAGAAGPNDPNRWFWEGQMHAARIARDWWVAET